MIEAIDAEIAAVGREAGRSFDVTGGRRVHRTIGSALYTFTAELQVPLAPETPVLVRHAGRQHRGVLAAVDDFHVLVHLSEDAGEAISTAAITSQPAFILESLRRRLIATASAGRAGLPTAGMAGALAGTGPVRSGSDLERATDAQSTLARLEDPALVPNPAQLRAMARVAGSDLHFVWGPPGTGKTANLAQIARMLVDAGDRILVLAHANVAVDVAMLRIAETFRESSDLAGGRIIRVGAPHHQDALRREEILLDGVLARRDPGGTLERRRLEERRRGLAARLRATTDDRERDAFAGQLASVRARLGPLRQRYKRLSDDLIREAVVVGATLSRFVLSEVLWELRPDAVLLDEASMASIPWVLAAATRTTKRLVVLGDFRQLPPVCVSQQGGVHAWLGRDAFDLAGIRERIDSGEDDERVTLLDTQYRMAKPIGEAVSRLAYGGRLRTDPTAAGEAALLADGEPYPGEPLLLVDTSLLHSACQLEAKLGSFSRANTMHLLLVLSLARVLGRPSALVSPYRAQARLLAAGVRDLALENASAATVHRFQGSERDVVILDLVDSHPQDTPSRLTGSDVDMALRLVNVGISRAKGKAIVLANCEFVESRFAPQAPVRRLLDLCREYGMAITPSASDVAEAFGPGGIEWNDDWQQLSRRLIEEVGTAARSLVVNVPRDFPLPGGLIAAIAAASRRGVRVTAFGPARLLEQLEEGSADLRLLTRPGFFASVDRGSAYVAGTPFSIGARACGKTLPGLLESLLVGERAPHATTREERPALEARRALGRPPTDLPPA
ncbi:MAG: DEAD/DEAH box helicase [Gaiellaceae bacterium]